MQALVLTRNTLMSEAVTRDMLSEIATKLFNKSAEWVQQMAEAPLKKGSATIKALTFAKLRATLDQLLTQSPAEEYGELYAKGELVVEFDCLPDLDIGNAGKNNKRERTASDKPSANKTTMVGAYVIVKRPSSPSVNGGDEGKWEIWQHVWNCSSFEEYFAQAPKKAVAKTGRIVTASSEIAWAVKSGWIKPVAAE